MPYKLSPSSLNLLKDCPRCFWLQFNRGIKRPEGIFPSLPSGMDRILKEHFDRFAEKGIFPPELRGQDCITGCSLFSDREKLKLWRNNLRGIQYFDEESGVLLRGAMDNLLVKGKKLIVLDYKTRGYPLKEDTHEHYQLQMDLYNFLLRKNGYETEDYAYLLFYYPERVAETGEVIFNTELIKIATDAERGEKTFRKAIEILNSEIPPEPADCKFCGFREPDMHSQSSSPAKKHGRCPDFQP